MGIGGKLEKLYERMARIEEQNKFILRDIGVISENLKDKNGNPVWLRVMTIFNGLYCAWLGVITWLVVKKGV